MPPLRESLSTAEEYLRRAASLREGFEQALSLKALVETLVWKLDSGGKADVKEIVSLSRRALRVGLAQHPPHALYLHAQLSRFES
jgi:hypothetical protein